MRCARCAKASLETSKEKTGKTNSRSENCSVQSAHIQQLHWIVNRRTRKPNPQLVLYKLWKSVKDRLLSAEDIAQTASSRTMDGMHIAARLRNEMSDYCLETLPRCHFTVARRQMPNRFHFLFYGNQTAQVEWQREITMIKEDRKTSCTFLPPILPHTDLFLHNALYNEERTIEESFTSFFLFAMEICLKTFFGTATHGVFAGVIAPFANLWIMLQSHVLANPFIVKFTWFLRACVHFDWSSITVKRKPKKFYCFYPIERNMKPAIEMWHRVFERIRLSHCEHIENLVSQLKCVK